MRLALLATVGGKEREDDKVAVCVGGEPVVREDRVRGVGFWSVLGHNHTDAVGTEQVYVRIEFGQCVVLCNLVVFLGLEHVVAGRLRVEAETDRLYHEDGRGCLLVHNGCFTILQRLRK